LKGAIDVVMGRGQGLARQLAFQLFVTKLCMSMVAFSDRGIEDSPIDF
jgi:hypothetical protein